MSKIRLTGQKQTIKNLNRMAAKYGQVIADAAVVSAEKVRGDAVQSIQDLSRGESVVRTRNGGKQYDHIASKPGDAPNTDTGQLVRSIRMEVDSDLRVFVGTSLEYGKHLEFGTKRMDARPWLNPALDKNRKFIRKSFGRIMKKTTEKGVK